ncbi:GNAT family N-acetyltransferase [Mesorhizobium australicum]|uniref:GNAT family N-acetyltransferase n=1 Tax=Mesorhizobium australicum TaxID=536018 RepID=UPI0033351C6B
MSLPIDIVDLLQKPDLLEAIAGRIWNAWRMREGLESQDVVQKFIDILASEAEFTLVAHRRDKFVGTTSVVTSDLPERSNLTPWVAEVWVEPEFRRHRIGSRLLEAAEMRAFNAGRRALYLYCTPPLRPFYSGNGWTEIEQGVGKDNVCIFRKNKISGDVLT